MCLQVLREVQNAENGKLFQNSFSLARRLDEMKICRDDALHKLLQKH